VAKNTSQRPEGLDLARTKPLSLVAKKSEGMSILDIPAENLAAKSSWEAANACSQFHGGFGFANEYDVDRRFRETRLYQVAPISTNLILSYVAEHILGLPRSF